MGLKKFAQIKKQLLAMVPEAFKHEANSNRDFLESGVMRSGYVCLMDGSCSLQRALGTSNGGSSSGYDNEDDAATGGETPQWLGEGSDADTGTPSSGQKQKKQGQNNCNPVQYLTGIAVGEEMRSEIERFIQLPNCSGVVCVIDLADNKTRAKEIDYVDRHHGVRPAMDDGQTIHISNQYFPIGDEWIAFKKNRCLRLQANWYLCEYMTSNGFPKLFSEELVQQLRSQHDSFTGNRIQQQHNRSDSQETCVYPEDEQEEPGFDIDGDEMMMDSSAAYTVSTAKARFMKRGSEFDREFESMAQQDRMEEDPDLFNDEKHKDKVREKFVVFDGGISQSQIFDRTRVPTYRCVEFRENMRVDLPTQQVRKFPMRDVRSSMIGEGELAVMYYSHKLHDRDQAILTVDSDAIILALLNTKNSRIDPQTGKFRNRIFVRMQTGGQSEWDKIKAENDKKIAMGLVTQENRSSILKPLPRETRPKFYTFVDVNALYSGIIEYYRKHLPTVRNPIETHCMFMMLGGTDFTWRNWTYRKGHTELFEKFVLPNYERLGLANMVRRHDDRMMHCDSLRPDRSLKLSLVDIDLKLFRKFAERVYIQFYGGTNGKKQPALSSYDAVRQALIAKNAKTPNAHPPELQWFNVFARNMMYVFLYWLNTHQMRLQYDGEYLTLFDCLARSKRDPRLSVWGYRVSPSTGSVEFDDNVDTEIKL